MRIFSCGPQEHVLFELSSAVHILQKRFYMRKEYLERFGMTPVCNGCTALLIGAPSANHSEVCRARIEGELAKGGGQDQTKFEESEAKGAKREDARKLALNG